MSNHEKCQDCPAEMPRGRMHVRSRSFKQVFWCPECWAIRKRIDRIVAAVRNGTAA